MTFTRTNAFGSDTDGPNTVAVTGTALAEIGTTVDPIHGLVAETLRFPASDLAFADTDFTTTIRFTLNYAFLGIRGELGPGVLGPGTPIAAGASEFYLAPLSLPWTDGVTYVDFTAESIPVDGMVFDLAGTAGVSALASGSDVEVVVTIPVAASAGRAYPYFNSDETAISGEIVLVGSYAVPAVPSLSAPASALLTLALLGVGVRLLRVDARGSSRTCSSQRPPSAGAT